MLTAGKPFTRQELVALKRADIQRLCKDYGVRANMKTEALIELLLDSIQSNMSPLVGPRPPQPQAPAPRRVSTRSSTRVSSLRSRGTSGSSSSNSFVASSSHTTSTDSPRTSKSKLTQYKLGVGRPSAATAAALRTSSRSSSTSKPNRPKTGRSYKPPEATIVEEPETSQTALADQNAVQSTSRINSAATDNDDVVVRLGRLESTFREADIKHQLESLRHVPTQVAYLKASMQQREAEIIGLRGELDVCKAEILTLRSEVSKVALLEDQLKAMRDTLDHLKAVTSLAAHAKGKVTRRVPTPFAESNTNASINSKPTTPVLSAAVIAQSTPTRENPVASNRPQTGLSEVALGKRPREANLNNGAAEDIAQDEPARRILPERKRARPGGDRRPLQEKAIAPKPEADKPVVDHDAGEDCVGSAGSSESGPSTQPSVTTPPATHGPEHFSEFNSQHELRSEEIDMLDFCHAASSTPRDDIFNFFDQGESFSQLSAGKLGARLAGHDANEHQQQQQQQHQHQQQPHQQQHQSNTPQQPIHQEPRRISTNVARPRTPPRPSGPGRFRVPIDNVTVDNLSPVREDIASPFDPYTDSVFGLPFGAGLNAAAANYARREVAHNQNQGIMPAPMPLALGFGLATATGALAPQDSPIRPIARTMYGTEVQNDTRFGDFGRDGVASGSNMDFWTNF